MSDMAELVSTDDPTVVSAVEALLGGAAIPHVVVDQNASVQLPGVLPRRILVAEDHLAAAQQLLRDAGLGDELRSHES